MLTLTVLVCPAVGHTQHSGFLCPHAGKTQHLSLLIALLQEKEKQKIVLENAQPCLSLSLSFVIYKMGAIVVTTWRHRFED